MNSFYLLSYNKVPLGIYNKLPYLFDYLLELIRFPDNNFNIFKVRIYLFDVNIGYPSSILIFKFNENLNKLFFEETNNKRVEMCPETFSKFKKIQNNLKNKMPKKKEENKKETTSESEPEIKTKEEIYKINRLKYQMKVLEKWNNKFNADLKLYYNFKKKIESEDFSIPEMFESYWQFFNSYENPEESFDDYFIKFNENSELELNEMKELLNNVEEDSDDNESIKDEDDNKSIKDDEDNKSIEDDEDNKSIEDDEDNK